MAALSCTYNPDFKYEGSCDSLGRPIIVTPITGADFTEEGQTTSAPPWTYTAYTYAHIPGLKFRSTDPRSGLPVFDRITTDVDCMVGRSDCSYGFSEAICPSGLFPATWGEANGVTTVSCCPTVPFASSTINGASFRLAVEMLWVPSTTNGQTMSNLINYNLCEYQWRSRGQNSMLPTSVPQETNVDDAYIQDLHVFYYQPVLASHTSFTLSLPPSTTTSGSGAARRTSDLKANTLSEHQQISPGAKAGIGAGAGVGALFLIVVIVAVLSRRRRKQKQRSATTGRDSTEKPELDGIEIEKHRQIIELGITEPHELSDTSKPVELNSRNIPASPVGELEGSMPVDTKK